jgi:hypothetical protein
MVSLKSILLHAKLVFDATLAHILFSYSYAVPIDAPELQLEKTLPKSNADIIESLKQKRSGTSGIVHQEDPSLIDGVTSGVAQLSIDRKGPAKSPANSIATYSHLGPSLRPSKPESIQKITATKYKQFVSSNPSFKKYHLSPVKAEGNCAFRSISTLVYGSEVHWRKVKREISDYACEYYDYLAEQLKVNQEDIVEFSEMDEPQGELLFAVAAFCYELNFGLVGHYGNHENKVYYCDLAEARGVDYTFFNDNHYTPMIKEKR